MPSPNAEIRLPVEITEFIVQSARTSEPAECCGALIGSSDFVSDWQIYRIVELTNRSEATATEYLITSDDVRFAQRKARGWSLDVVGFYHSHPNGAAAPSATDLERAWPGYVYLIVAAGSVTAWTLDEQRGEFGPVQFA